MMNTLRRIDNMLMAAATAAGNERVTLKVSAHSDARQRYSGDTVVLTVGTCQVKIELVTFWGVHERFVCVDMVAANALIAFTKLHPAYAIVDCSVSANFDGMNEATSLDMQLSGGSGVSTVLFHALKSAQRVTADGPQPNVVGLKWDLRSKMLCLMQAESPIYSAAVVYKLLCVWCAKLTVDENKNVIFYLHTEVPETLDVTDSVHDMLVKFCIDNSLKILAW
jgi:hypothetical protein